MIGDHRGQKRTLHLLELATDSCELPHGCWGSNGGPLEEQAVLALNH